MTTIGKRCSKSGNSLIHRSIQDDTLEPRFNRGHVESLRIEPWGTDGLRVRATIGDDVTYEDWALSEPVDNSISDIDITETEATIRNGNISARISDTRVQQAHIEIFRHPENGDKISVLSEKNYIVIQSNNDSGSDIIRQEYERFGQYSDRIKILPSIRFALWTTNVQGILLMSAFPKVVHLG